MSAATAKPPILTTCGSSAGPRGATVGEPPSDARADAGRAVAGALLPSMNSLLEVLNQAARNPGGFFAGLAKQADLGALRGQIDGLRTAAERMEPAVARARATLAGGQGSFLAQDSARQTIRNYERLQSAAADYLAHEHRVFFVYFDGGEAAEARPGHPR